MSRFWNSVVQNLDPYIPGEQPQGGSMIKLNTNENPFAPSPKVIEAIKAESNQSLRLYPDPNSASLKASIARYYDLDSAHIFVGNGSDEVLAHIFQAYFADRGTLSFPDISYSFYPVYCGLYQIDYERVPLQDNFELNLEKWTDGSSHSNLIFPNPNAPTGMGIALEQVEKVLQSNGERIVVVDEAYIDFGGQSAIQLVENYDNLIVTQTFSKSRSLAGMRLGFAIAHPSLIEGLERVKNSFNSYPVDRLASAAGIAAIEDTVYFEKTRDNICEIREKTIKALAELSFETLPSHANFIFTQHKKVPAKDLYQYLRAQNIIVRYFDKPRIDNFLRVSIGTQEEMNVFIEALKRYEPLAL